MSSVWCNDTSLATNFGDRREPQFQDFGLAVIGHGGRRKTTVLKMCEALAFFSSGPDTVRKLAPSNAVARLLGGHALHSLCKLSFVAAPLTSKKGRLAADTLKHLRKGWQSAVAAYLAETCLISADQVLQCDVRMRQANMEPEQRFGVLATSICWDFLQLLPAKKIATERA